MAEEISIDKNAFHDRLSSFISQWKADKRSGDAVFNGASSIVIMVGKANDAQAYPKNVAFQLWLLGYEFPTTLFVITQESIHIVTTKKKAAYLEPLKGGKVPVELHIRGKDAEENAKQFQQCLEGMKAAGKKVGVLTKDQSTGPFVEEWKKSYGDIFKDAEEVDCALALSSAALSVKDEKELRAIRDASKASSGIANYFVDEMSEILDAEKKITHQALADRVSSKLDDSKFFQKLKVSNNFDPMNLDWSFQPVVQSGGNYDLKFSADSDKNNLHAGVIVAALGLRYQSYSSMIARTYMVDPNKSQEANYKLLSQVHQTVLSSIKDGVQAKEVYAKAIGLVKSKKQDLDKHFPKNVGGGIGIEIKDPTLLLNAKNVRTLKDGMTLQISTSFSDLVNSEPQDSKSKKYSLIITDTVRVTASDVVIFTKDSSSDLESCSFFFKDEEEEKASKPSKAKKDPRVGAVASSNITKTRLRHERQTNQNAEKEEARREHQKELHARKQREGLDTYGTGTGTINGTAEKKFKRFESYKRDNQFPPRVKDLIVLVDDKNLTVVLPIMGRPVPFHINTIKNASNSPEGDFTSLRINFLSPGQGVGRKDDQPFEDPTAHFVRSLTFRSRDIDRMEQIAKQITELKKESVRREQEKKQMEDVVEQDKLITVKNRKPAVIDMIFVRPALDGKRVPGAVEIHQNGLRYNHGNGQHIDVLFSNIKHLFFQPCQHELIVIIHVHLKNPIMIGKKKAKDVQFYREATEMQFDETGNRKRKHRYGDEEEFEAEQEERRRRGQLDKEFKVFAEKIADAGRNENVGVDIPFRELGFNGVPSRSSVWIQPTTDCLVQLTEPPFLVLTLNEIEVVHLERVQFGLKNFDMVVVFKDFTRPPSHVNTIPVESLDAVKDWLDSVEIPFSEGPVNLNWATIMKTVQADPHQFFVDGGWSFIAADSDEEGGDESEEVESNFEISDSELAESESESEEESDFDEYASDEETDAPSDVSEGEDWDELEKRAKKKDQDAGSGSEDDDRGQRKRKR
ncbi:fact complex subunit spt16 [Diplodia corticola]|uniref:FACT complex subunit n=1 Tax=Diplodia corticola TaxID=236234 RepID=A0A1J9RBD2_9PEZI|nr:fact complex subunit spt16 [Diplodia corticola]OJD37458.1 fact complex subunit spt16 [Diplodia corticola]